ncbi:hypothetical protein [Inquilinus sp. OTU3971]|uniref:hypothetical protein n=1 Tax=Inquilinus sp. OTU3971 TaxID=3043855 RepID=UPI00313CC249
MIVASEIPDIDIENRFIWSREFSTRPLLINAGMLSALSICEMSVEGQDYGSAIERCTNVAAPMCQKLKSLGLRAWLVLFGAKLSSGWLEQNPQYSLMNMANKCGLKWSRQIEKSFTDEEGIQQIGAYEIDWTSISTLLRFSNYAENAFVVASDLDLFGRSGISEYLRGVSEESRELTGKSLVVDWRLLATRICDEEAILIHVDGKFDDNWRSVNFISSSERYARDKLSAIAASIRANAAIQYR